jgi:tetratricopeptide (TPR) repeat protein
VELAQVSRAAESALLAGEPEQAAHLARLALLRLPRHLASYERVIRAAWTLKRWQEGEDWARRLLQADPGNAVAWRSLAYAVEQKGMLAAARPIWRRAFQLAPTTRPSAMGWPAPTSKRAALCAWTALRWPASICVRAGGGMRRRPANAWSRQNPNGWTFRSTGWWLPGSRAASRPTGLPVT